MHEPENPQPYLETRLFCTRADTATAVASSRSVVAPQPADVAFAGAAAGRIPAGSIYGARKESEPVEDTADVGAWVTVIGVTPGSQRDVIAFFSQFGVVTRADDTPGNWMYLEFASLDAAKSAAQGFECGPQLVSSQMAVTCELGRVKSSYCCDSAAEDSARPSFAPRSSGERSAVASRLFDEVSGQ